MSPLPAVAMFLAQQSRPASRRDLSEATSWLVMLMAVVLLAFIVAGIVIYIVRKRALKADTDGANIPLTLADVRRMRAGGEIDDAEMSRLKEIVLAQTRKDRPRGEKPEGEKRP
jgi:uncharacterized membrane protein